VWINKAVACGPNDPSAGMFYWNRGRALFFQEQYSEAIEPLRRAVELRSNLWHSQLYLASAYVMKKPPDLKQATDLVTDFCAKHSGFTVVTVQSYEDANRSTYLEKGRKNIS
jgi:tetratricopeptide (TPR) repeat protein